MLDANFRDSVKEAVSGEYPPTIQPKIWLRCRDGGSSKCVEDHDMDIAVYNMSQEMISPDNLSKGCMAAAIIEPNTAWCSSMGVGVTWVAKQVVVKPIPKESFAFSMGSEYDVLRSEDKTNKRPLPEQSSESDKRSRAEPSSEEEQQSSEEEQHVDDDF